MSLKTLPIAGPSSARITITTTATKTRINAYSTRPWPFSLGANSIFVTSFLFIKSLSVLIIVCFGSFSRLLALQIPYNLVVLSCDIQDNQQAEDGVRLVKNSKLIRKTEGNNQCQQRKDHNQRMTKEKGLAFPVVKSQ